MLYSLHHIMPSQFYNDMDYGEQAIVRAFLNYEIEQKIKEQKEIEKAAKAV